MPPIRSHHRPERWRGEHTPAVFRPVRRITGPAVLGINFPVNHDTYPNDCENTACTKIGDRYRPGSWIIMIQDYDEGDKDFFEVEYYACMECVERSKRSFLGYRLLGKHKAEPVLMAKDKEKELPPIPAEVPFVATGPMATTSPEIATTTGSPRVRLPGMLKKESPMQRAIKGGSASMAEIAQQCIPIKDIGTKIRFTPWTLKPKPWVPIKAREGIEPYHCYLQQENKMFQPVYRLNGYCYLYLINPWYHREYQWPPQPTMAQLSRIPKEIRNNWSTRIYQVDNSIYHLEPDASTRY